MDVLTEQVVPEQPSPAPGDAEAPAQNTASAEVDPAESKPKESDPAQETKKALRGVQKRIDELTRARYEAEERGRQEAEHWRQQAEAYRQQAEAFKQHIGPPRSDQYQDYEKFLADLAAYKADEVSAKRIEHERMQQMNWQRQQYEAQQRAQAEAQYQATLQAKLQEAQKKFPDFIDVVSSPELPGLQGTPAFGAILESEFGPEVMYHLGKNPEKAHHIVSLSPVSQVREIGRIEASIAAGKSVSNAPPPPASVDARSGTASKTPRNMTPDEYYAHITRTWKGKPQT